MVAAGFPVDTDAELDLVVGQFEAGPAGRRYDARGQRHAERAGAFVDLPGQGRHRSQVRALLGRRPGDLLDEHGRAGTPPSGRPPVVHGHVIVDQHGLDPYPVRGGQPGGHLEVQDVAGVVLHDVEHAGSGVHGLRGGQDPVRYRRGEHLTGAGRVEHPVPDEPAVQWLVPGPAAGEQAHLARRRPGDPGDVPPLDVDAQRRVRGRHPGQGVDEDLVGIVDQLLRRLDARHDGSGVPGAGRPAQNRVRSGSQ